MKKNILFVQSFLILPLLTSSFAFSMDSEKTTYANAAEKAPQLPQQPIQRKQRRQEKERQQRQSLPQPIKSTKTNSATEYLSPADAADAKSDLADAKERITGSSIEASEKTFLLYSIRNQSENKKFKNHVEPVVTGTLDAYYPREQETNTFEKSTLGIQTEARGIAFFGRLANSLTSYTKAVIGFFSNDTFEVDNQDHLRWLDKAITECTENDDMKSLLFIAQTCEEKYPSIRFSDSSALFKCLQEKYTKQVQASHQALQGYNQEYATKFNEESAALKEQIIQLSNAHGALTLQLAQAYETKIKEEQQKIADLQKFIAGTSVLLNRQDNLKKITLPAQNRLSIPENSVETVRHATDKRLSSLVTNSNLPLIYGPISK